MASRKERLNQSNPFAQPGEESPPSLADLTGSMLSNNDELQRIIELEERIAELEEMDPENAIVVRQDGLSKHYKKFELRDTQLVIPDETNETDWVEIGILLMRMQGTIQWLLGDWLVYGQSNNWENGSGYARMKELFGYEIESLWSYASVCRKVPALTRVKELSFSHHRAVTKFADNPEKQQAWLERAHDENWSAKQLISEIQHAEKPALPDKKLKPWQEKLARLEADFEPSKWTKLSFSERREAMTQLQSLLLKLEEMGLD